jgi:iron-sulfur cluster assembly protein
MTNTWPIDSGLLQEREEHRHMITVTPAAAEQLRELLAKQGDENTALRVFVSPGGCSGFQYGMALDNVLQEGDQVFEQDGIKLVVDEYSIEYLDGSEIDYVDGLMGAGFTVYNPNAVSTCGCGHSFRTADQAGQAQKCH